MKGFMLISIFNKNNINIKKKIINISEHLEKYFKIFYFNGMRKKLTFLDIFIYQLTILIIFVFKN
jgi:hypothetical protein